MDKHCNRHFGKLLEKIPSEMEIVYTAYTTYTAYTAYTAYAAYTVLIALEQKGYYAFVWYGYIALRAKEQKVEAGDLVME